MIRGKMIRLRTVRETDLDRLYALLTDIGLILTPTDFVVGEESVQTIG